MIACFSSVGYLYVRALFGRLFAALAQHPLYALSLRIHGCCLSLFAIYFMWITTIPCDIVLSVPLIS